MKFLIFLFLLSSKLMATTIPAGSTTGGPQVIGGLYNSERDYFDAGVRCMEMDPVKDVEIIFNEVATVNLASAIDYKTMVRELSRGAGADITLGSGDQFGFSVDFLRKSKETDTSIVFVYKTILKAGDEVLKTPYRLTEEAKKLAAMGPDVFKKYCGDQFVYKVSKGARAYVVVKIELGSVEKKKQVKAKFHLNFVDLVEISATLKKLRKDFQVKADVKILGYQEGGFAARINSIFGNGRGVSNCSAPDLKNCEVTIASVLDYFANEFPLQFEPYFRDNSGSGFIRLPSTSFPLLYSSQSYCKLPPTERPSGIECDEPNNLMSFDKIKESQEKNRVHLEMLNNLRIDPKNGLSKESESLLSKLEGHIQSNLGKLQNARELCFRDPWACASIVSKMKQELIELEADDLVKIKTEERIEICFETGMANEIGGFELKLTKKSKELTTFTKYDAPEFASKNCFIFSAPNLTQEPDGIEISIKRHTEIDSRKCKIRTMRKFFSGYDWDLQKINVTNFITGHKVSFKGKRLKEKMKCRYEEEADVYSKWIKLKAI